jgi:hypothetical protein
MEYLNIKKDVFEKKLLIESRKVFMKLQKEAIMKKWIKSGILDELINPVAIDLPEDDDDELDIF